MVPIIGVKKQRNNMKNLIIYKRFKQNAPINAPN